MSETVLVTGGTGFVGGWAIVELLKRGYQVRTTVRDLKKEDQVRRTISAETDPGDRLSVVAADLNSDDGWPAAVAGCDYVLHVASPLTATSNEEEVIRPAVDGTLRVLRAARDAGVRRVVYTSSCAAVYYGHPEHTGPFDETSWTDVNGEPMSAYVKSKALAERAAWDFVAAEGGKTEFTTVNPTGIFGPALGNDVPSSLRLIEQLTSGKTPAVPDLWFGIVDVRDVVDLHIRAMTSPDAGGERYIASTDGTVAMIDVARVLRERLGDKGSKVPTRKLPSWIFRIVARFNVELGDLVPLLGARRNATGAKARNQLGWSPRPWQDAVVASGENVTRV
ncbi:NAD-dependent epimerase/dehydratase family protein [Antrihabitans cavernicola]|uniref:NAD-dependent epimerase/dehydratase family protein n=1 Tax=Antrihabitans cavernicola TaxID=2495913 RepID=A0A5A7S5W2_9NOCA|nr:NAD-dependent epimerase/dehydratase family protein [Spelaeibacter cavernicola]KAA0017394.1 NAD-dependent epimerase/dehydratase family protein [Spelaeibacter cavernicola]